MNSKALIATFLFMAAIVLVAPAMADPPSTNSNNKVDDMEQKSFGRLHSNEPIDARLARLEKYMFGATANGSIEQRINNLYSAKKSAENAALIKPFDSRQLQNGSRQPEPPVVCNYFSVLRRSIKRKWVPPKSPAPVVVVFTWGLRGLLTNIHVTSGLSESSNQAATNAVRDSSPILPRPGDYAPDALDVEFTFDSTGPTRGRWLQ